ncbi:Alpha/Beta hydrolase protein [Pelagophyceae sp. CCMP2097]|nr:Alpha/Beta hydrolase protein [Pelagophyceae sp. CCMP2097]|mmetsp:Transcript_7874/g.25719  ORF Transcript_7874/g.25719 Transcript_7874/m.25719 type:complete len:377 (+) Transcript_7874:124-1254(+)
MRFLLLAAGAGALVPSPPSGGGRVVVPQASAIGLAEAFPRELVWSAETGVSTSSGEVLTRTWSYTPAGGETLNVAYLALGPLDAPPVLLVHGFGASSFHWRANVESLAETRRVYAIDLLGFGGSDKPIMTYDADLWVDQCAAFLREVAGCGADKKAIVAGNSIGGFTALAVAALHPDLVSAVASLNGAGKFSAPPELALAMQVQRDAIEALDGPAKAWNNFQAAASAALQRFVVGVGFIFTKQPARIQQVLRQVYPVAPDRADEALVASIAFPARDANAPEVFYRIVSRNADGPPRDDRTIDALLRKLKVPLLLCWGERDPWIVSSTGDRIQRCAAQLGIDVRRVSIDAGHCPHDENPSEVNAALLDFFDHVEKRL